MVWAFSHYRLTRDDVRRIAADLRERRGSVLYDAAETTASSCVNSYVKSIADAHPRRRFRLRATAARTLHPQHAPLR
jgi:hypothetical protein